MPSPGPGIHSRPTTPHSGNTRSSSGRCGQPSPRLAAPRCSLRPQVRAASPRHGCKGTPRSPHTRKPLAGVQPQPGALNLFPFLRHSRHCDHERAPRGTTPAPGPPASLRPGVEDVPRPALSVSRGASTPAGVAHRPPSGLPP